jgi:hypothetical protein
VPSPVAAPAHAHSNDDGGGGDADDGRVHDINGNDDGNGDGDGTAKGVGGGDALEAVAAAATSSVDVASIVAALSPVYYGPFLTADKVLGSASAAAAAAAASGSASSSADSSAAAAASVCIWPVAERRRVCYMLRLWVEATRSNVSHYTPGEKETPANFAAADDVRVGIADVVTTAAAATLGERFCKTIDKQTVAAAKSSRRQVCSITFTFVSDDYGLASSLLPNTH